MKLLTSKIPGLVLACAVGLVALSVCHGGVDGYDVSPPGTFHTQNLIVDDAAVIQTLTTTQRNVTFGKLASALPASPTVTDDWDPWAGGLRTQLVRVQTNQVGSILGSLLGGTVGDVVVLENHGDGTGAYGAGDLKILIKKSSDPGTVANHIYLPNLTDIVVPYTGAIVLYYDATDVGWIPIGMSVGGSFERLAIDEVSISNPLTPSALGAGNTNNYDPTGGQFDCGQKCASWLRLNGDASGSVLTGLVAYGQAGPSNVSSQGPVKIIQNIGGPITLSSEDTNSDAANRFNLPFGSFVIPPNGVVMLLYDLQGGGSVNQARWRVIGGGANQFSKQTFYQAITDVTLGATVNDYNPTGFNRISRLRLAPSGGGTDLTGLVAQEDGAIRTITAYGAGLKLKHQNGGSSAANQFYLPGAADITLNVGGSVTLVYDGTFGAWFCLSKE